MFERIHEAEGVVFDRPGYHADADRVEAGLSDVIWKLERSQYFNEVGDPAWEAFLDGDWSRVMEIFESERAAVRDEAESYRERKLELRRLRVVQFPLTPYMRWELHSHRIFVECGLDIRVLDAGNIAHIERNGPLPELMVYGGRALYRVRYDDDWTPIGAVRVDRPEIITEAAQAVAELYAGAEPLPDFFERNIEELAPSRARPDDPA